ARPCEMNAVLDNAAKTANVILFFKPTSKKINTMRMHNDSPKSNTTLCGKESKNIQYKNPILATKVYKDNYRRLYLRQI
ncbi:MAG: hypothetical protein ACI8VI_000713, partial [Granulosicoccus sp.]